MTHESELHSHHHHHHPAVSSLNKAFLWGIALNAGFVVVEFAVGLWYGSMGLLSDARGRMETALSDVPNAYVLGRQLTDIANDYGLSVYLFFDNGTSAFDFDDATYSELAAMLGGYKEEGKLPAYLIMQQKALIGITNILPTSANDLLMIPGIGKKLIENYGAELIALVEEYKKNFHDVIDN